MGKELGILKAKLKRKQKVESQEAEQTQQALELEISRQLSKEEETAALARAKLHSDIQENLRKEQLENRQKLQRLHDVNVEALKAIEMAGVLKQTEETQKMYARKQQITRDFEQNLAGVKQRNEKIQEHKKKHHQPDMSIEEEPTAHSRHGAAGNEGAKTGKHTYSRHLDEIATEKIEADQNSRMSMFVEIYKNNEEELLTIIKLETKLKAYLSAMDNNGSEDNISKFNNAKQHLRVQRKKIQVSRGKKLDEIFKVVLADTSSDIGCMYLRMILRPSIIDAYVVKHFIFEPCKEIIEYLHERKTSDPDTLIKDFAAPMPSLLYSLNIALRSQAQTPEARHTIKYFVTVLGVLFCTDFTIKALHCWDTKKENIEAEWRVFSNELMHCVKKHHDDTNANYSDYSKAFVEANDSPKSHVKVDINKLQTVCASYNKKNLLQKHNIVMILLRVIYVGTGRCNVI